MLTWSNNVVDGPCKLLKQSFELPMGFRFLPRPTVLECASDRSSQSRVGLFGLPRLAGGIPPAAGRHWSRRFWNLQKALQPDLLCRVMCNRGYIFTLFTKSQFTPTQVPLQVDSVTTPDWILFFFGVWVGGGSTPLLGGPEAPLYSRIIFTVFTSIYSLSYSEAPFTSCFRGVGQLRCTVQYNIHTFFRMV